MKKIIKNRTATILGSILIILIFTNPSNPDFKEYLIAKGNSKPYAENFGGKTANFFIFSIFEINRKRKSRIPLIYRSIGILNNFIVIQDYREESEKVQ